MHETDTMQALCWNARAFAVRHQSRVQQLKTPIQLAQRPRIAYFRPILGEENLASWQHIAYSAIRTFSADFRQTKIRRRIRLTAPARESTASFKQPLSVVNVSVCIQHLQKDEVCKASMAILFSNNWWPISMQQEILFHNFTVVTCTGMGMTGIPRTPSNPAGIKVNVTGPRGNGSKCYGSRGNSFTLFHRTQVT